MWKARLLCVHYAVKFENNYSPMLSPAVQFIVIHKRKETIVITREPNIFTVFFGPKEIT